MEYQPKIFLGVEKDDDGSAGLGKELEEIILETYEYDLQFQTELKNQIKLAKEKDGLTSRLTKAQNIIHPIFEKRYIPGSGTHSGWKDPSDYKKMGSYKVGDSTVGSGWVRSDKSNCFGKDVVFPMEDRTTERVPVKEERPAAIQDPSPSKDPYTFKKMGAYKVGDYENEVRTNEAGMSFSQKLSYLLSIGSGAAASFLSFPYVFDYISRNPGIGDVFSDSMVLSGGIGVLMTGAGIILTSLYYDKA